MLKNRIALAAVLAALAGPALASDPGHDQVASDRNGCPARPAAEWLSADQVTQKLKEQGYTVGKVETSHGCYEVKATDANGVRIELYVDPATAQVVGHEGRS